MHMLTHCEHTSTMICTVIAYILQWTHVCNHELKVYMYELVCESRAYIYNQVVCHSEARDKVITQ